MFQRSFLPFIIIAFLTAGAGCYESSPKTQPGDGSESDLSDDGVRADDDRMDEVPIDDWRWEDGSWEDWIPEDLPVEEEVVNPCHVEGDLPCPAVCQTAPTGGEIGAACTSSASCDYAAHCLPEQVESFDGEIYVDLYGGACVLYGAGPEACDPAVPEICPDGSRCVFMGSAMGQDFYGCWDSCEPVDTSGNPYEYNCGCRVGYACSLTRKICLSGCSNDRLCCEGWSDLDGDTTKEADEIVVKEGCTNVCDEGGLFEGDEACICSVSFKCTNEGDPSARWGGPCVGDAWCPPDGTCYNEFNYRDEEMGETLFPGGYCVKEACQYVGRGCSDFGGACANLGTGSHPLYYCVGACHTGRELNDPLYECRTTPGEEQACVPVDPGFWLSAPPAGEDGYCWPGNFPGSEKAIGAPCESDDECVSPFGLGMCFDIDRAAMTPFCSVSCNEASASHASLCGGNDGSGTATGACWSGLCWEACAEPGGSLGSNSCSSPDNACYHTATMGTYVVVAGGLNVPPGICLPACTSDSWCEDFWGVSGVACNTINGVCGG